MNPVTTISGTATPLDRANVDTDQIMPKQFLKRVERTGYGEFVFWDWKRLPDGTPDSDFPLNNPEHEGSVILLTGPNFGSGSSREHAPWGLQDYGFEAVVASSFADIFYNNCCNIGLLPVELHEKEVRWLMELVEHEPTAQITIDLETQTVTADGFEATFDIDPAKKHRLLRGLDPIGVTLDHADAIDAFEERRPAWLPTLTA
jgi:3-isopropylmalate/(R)-2-methylmalate dehydratase small subunit